MPPAKSDTSEQILDTAEELIQHGGFHAFSFQDIAERIGIRKASIYYHHPAKAELGRAVIARYRQRFQEIMAAIDANQSIGYWEGLALYLEPIVQLSRSDNDACLCGILCGEYQTLPPEMQVEIAAYFDEHQRWLAKLLERGRKAGEFHFAGSPAKTAKLLFSAIEGALLIKRATGNAAQFDEVMSLIKSLLSG